MKLIALLLYCYIAIFPFGQLSRLPLRIPEVNLYLTDIIVAGLVVSWLGWRLVKKNKLVIPPLTKPIFLFFILAFLSLIFNAPLLTGREVGVAFLYLVRWMAYAGVYFVIYELGQRIRNKQSLLLRNWKLEIRNLLIGTGVTAAAFGLLQYIFLPDTRFLEFFGWDPHYYRVVGTFLDPGFLGAILVLTLILVVISYINISYKGKREKRLLIFAGIFVYIALALTYSRASYLAYLMGMGIIAWFKKSPKFFLAVLLIGIITVFLLPRPGGEGIRLERTSTIQFRIINWKQSLTIAREHPLFGVGFNAYRYAQKKYGFLDEWEWQTSHAGAGADSSLLLVLATTGVFGFLAYLYLWWKILKTASLIVLASGLALLIHSFFLNSLFYPWLMAWVWILLGTQEGG